MYYYLVSSLKRRLILELQDSFRAHPIYSKIVPFIQDKHVFEERPQYGIVVMGASANKVQWSPDNFLGTIQSHVMLAYVEKPVFPLEWIREDLNAIRGNNGAFPSPPGVYFLEILSAPTNPSEPGYFAIDPLLTEFDRPVLHFQSGIEREAQLEHAPVQETLRLWENGRYLLKEGTDYTVDYTTGAIQIISRFNPGSTLTADYRRAGTSIGPVEYRWNTSDYSTIPGVVMAFGKRGKAGDKVAVVTTPDRVDAAQAFGGKFELSFDLTVIARDPTQREEISDFTIMSLWNDRKAKLEFEGIEIVDVSIGGESEETYDETANDFFYNASVSVQMRADWEAHYPLPLTISRVTPDRPDGTSGIQEVSGDMFYATHPIIVGRNDDFERIR